VITLPRHALLAVYRTGHLIQSGQPLRDADVRHPDLAEHLQLVFFLIQSSVFMKPDNDSVLKSTAEYLIQQQQIKWTNSLPTCHESERL
jgi:hypothetical protein